MDNNDFGSWLLGGLIFVGVEWGDDIWNYFTKDTDKEKTENTIDSSNQQISTSDSTNNEPSKGNAHVVTVTGRVWHWIPDNEFGHLKLTDRYEDIQITIYDDGTMYYGLESVHYSDFDGYEYSCNHGNTGYVFNLNN